MGWCSAAKRMGDALSLMSGNAQVTTDIYGAPKWGQWLDF